MNNRKLKNLQTEMRECRLCVQAGFELTPGAIFSGSTRAGVMVIGQAPGVTEVEAKRPFNASSGRRLFKWLGSAGWQEAEFRRLNYMTAVTKCYPGKNDSGRGDRVPTRKEQSLCRPFLNKEMLFVNPRLLIPVGSLAIKLFYQRKANLREIIGTALYNPPEKNISDVISGSKYPPLIKTSSYHPEYPMNGQWIVPLPHPSGASTWPNIPENILLIESALTILGDIKRGWQL